MPYQIVPGLAIITLAFTAMGAGWGAVNKWQFRREHQAKIHLLTDWDRWMDDRDRKLFAKAAAEAAAAKQ